MASKPHKFRASAGGFTLIEIIVGLVALSASFVILTAFIFPQAQRSAEPILQVRASALGQAFLDEIMGRSFDENSDRVGGEVRCGDFDHLPCTLTNNFGPDSAELDGSGDPLRALFNDVDDFHQIESDLPNVEDALGFDMSDRYANFSYAIDICYSDITGSCISDLSSVTQYKRIKVTIVTPLGQPFVFTGIRGNY